MEGWPPTNSQKLEEILNKIALHQIRYKIRVIMLKNTVLYVYIIIWIKIYVQIFVKFIHVCTIDLLKMHAAFWGGVEVGRSTGLLLLVGQRSAALTAAYSL